MTVKNMMICWLNHLLWEVKKGFKHIYLKIEMVILNLCLWPLVTLLILIFFYAPFIGGDGWKRSFHFTGGLPLSVFLLTGTFVLGIFAEYIAIGFQMASQRDQGVLEAVFITPVNRLRYLVGNALSSALTGTLTLLIFFGSAILLFHISIAHPAMIILAIIILIITSVPWGAFLCSIFLLGRNSRVLYTLFEEPAEFLSGVRFPVQVLPPILFLISSVYPVTHSINLLRSAFARYPNWNTFVTELIWLLILGAIYLGMAWFIAIWAEHRGRKRGNLGYN